MTIFWKDSRKSLCGIIRPHCKLWSFDLQSFKICWAYFLDNAVTSFYIIEGLGLCQETLNIIKGEVWQINSFSSPKAVHTNKVGIGQKEEKLLQDYIRVSLVLVLVSHHFKMFNNLQVSQNNLIYVHPMTEKIFSAKNIIKLLKSRRL